MRKLIPTTYCSLIVYSARQYDNSISTLILQVAVSTLSLFNVLFEFYCEDFWYEVIFKYLLPQNHLMVSQRNSILPKIEFYESSLRFLSLIPPLTMETLGSDTVTAHYLQYLNSESQRWDNLDRIMGIVPCSSLTAEESSESTNQMYPMWKRRYDGSDSSESKLEIRLTEASMAKSSKVNLDSNDNHRNLISCNTSSTKVIHDPLSNSYDNPDPESPVFTTINLQPNGFEEANPESCSGESTSRVSTTETRWDPGESVPMLQKLSVVTNHSEDSASLEYSSGSHVSEDASSTIGSFGPFLDTVFVQLSNWPNLDLNVILMLTEVVSILASSRIPLISSLLLDPNLTLQPCYTTFNTLLKRIGQDLEYHMQRVPSEVLNSVWEQMNPPEPQTNRRNSNCSTSSGMFALTSLSSTNSSLGEHIGDSIRRRISGGGSGGAIANVFHLINRKINTSVVPKVHPSSGTEVLTYLGGAQGYRYI
jgi:hypothetical protein